MKFTMWPALAGLGLAVSPIALSAQDDTTVSYDDAMKCSALFSLMTGGAEGQEADEFEEMAVRWLLVAMERDGTEDGSKAETELESMVDEMIDALDELEEEEAGEEFLTAGIDFCEAKHELIAEEINGLEID